MVETYVPIMVDDDFHGAVETYYDVTLSTQAIVSLTNHSIVTLSLVSFALLVLLYIALRHADQSIVAKDQAELELRRNNEELENRVAERAGELLLLNRNLQEEVAEKTLAQTALSEALSDMEEAKNKIDGIIHSVKDGLLVVDHDGNILMTNSPAEILFDATAQDLVGLSIREISLPEGLAAALEKVLENPGEMNVDFSLKGYNGASSKFYQARSSVMTDQYSSISGAVVLIQDVTIEREVDQLKRDFLAMAAHELMTPLSAIMGYSELLTSETGLELTDEQRMESLGYIHNKAESLARIVDDLLDVSRIEAGQQISISEKEFDLCRTLEKLIDVYRKTNPSHNFQLKLDCADCRMVADPMRIEQVLENLLSNAVKYSPAGGDVLVQCHNDKTSCQLSVVDNGIGMTEQQLERIFEKFYRVDASDTAQRGVGLGLSITKHIVSAHGGEIKVKSQPGKGTEVIFTLPGKIRS